MDKVLTGKGKNYLLVKDDVGKSKPVTRQLPPEGFTYGKPDKKDLEGAGLVTSSWKVHEQSKSKDPERDFKKMNKMGIKEGVIDPKVSIRVLNYFRKQKSIGTRMTSGRILGRRGVRVTTCLQMGSLLENLTVPLPPLMG